ncbi:N-acetylneuraminate synthase [Candidatus Pristimantibacillus sp. PTI5]|uniref:N-acetylneuraminate synthase n=1 Tax=Candidatus Pristimantibacillus sp. PTI5 TaxID=3400422 RepID=UPI003B01DFEB
MAKTFIIAEAGVNHNGSLEMAVQLIDAAVEAGTDAVKFQTFKADNLVTRNAAKAEYQNKTTDSNETQYEMIKKLELDEEAHQYLINYCKNKGIEFLSTPFDHDSVDLLVQTFNLSQIKVSSGDLTNAPLLLQIAQTGKPIIISTGMSNLSEIEQALSVLAFGYMNNQEQPSIRAFELAYSSEAGQSALRKNVTILHCTTEYPAPFAEVNLRAMDTLKQAFGLTVGFSDHTPGIAIPVAAVARGAMVIEKHFTLDRTLPGPDHKASLEPNELKLMVQSIRQVEMALGSTIKRPADSEHKNMEIARKSILASKPIFKGQKFSEENLMIKRPGDGVAPIHYWSLLGREADTDYEAAEPVRL